MRTKITLVLLLLNVALFSWIVHTRHRWQLETEAADRARRPFRELTVNLQAIEINGTDKVRLERASGKPWNILSPVDWPANPAAVDAFIAELQNLESKAVLDPAITGQTFADYDLEKPAYTLVLTSAPASPHDPAPSPATFRLSNVGKGGKLYLLAADGKHVHVLDGGWLQRQQSFLNGKALTSKSIFTIRPAEVVGLSVQSLATNEARPVHLSQSDGRWLLTSPVATRAAKAATQAMLGGLTRLDTPGFIKPPPAKVLSEFLITIEGDKRSETLVLGQAVPDLKARDPRGTPRYAKIEGRDTHFIIVFPNALFDTLTAAQEKLRDPHVLDFDATTVTGITLVAPSQPEPLMLQRLDSAASAKDGATADWQITRVGGTLPADRERVVSLLTRLAALSATRFENDSPSREAADRLGFTRPEREITLTFAPGAVPAKLTLEIGLDEKHAAFARVAAGGPPFIYALGDDALDALSVSPLTYRDRLVRTLPDNAQITALTITPTSNGPPLYSHTLAEKETWEQAISAETAARREALKNLLIGKDGPALLRRVRARQVDGFAYATFVERVPVNGTLRPWAYRLIATIALPGGTAGTASTFTLYLADPAGATQLAGSPATEANTVFALEPTLKDAFDALLNGEHSAPPPVAAPASPSVKSL